MAIIEQKSLVGVRLDMEAGEVIASWITRYMDGETEIKARLDHLHYGQDKAAELAAEVPGGDAYATAMGW